VLLAANAYAHPNPIPTRTGYKILALTHKTWQQTLEQYSGALQVDTKIKEEISTGKNTIVEKLREKMTY